MNISRWRFFSIAALAVFAQHATSAPVPSQSKPVTWEQILEWLPEDTENLLVAPVQISIPNKSDTQEKALFVSEAFVSLAIVNFNTAFKEMFEEELAGLKTTCLVQGSRRSTRPKDV